MFYLRGFNVEYPFAVVECPACGRPHEVKKEDWTTKAWTVTCEACGGLFGAVTPVEFRRHVHNSWTEKKSPEPVYVDLYVVELKDGGVFFSRWHGWVDRETRAVVQIG